MFFLGPCSTYHVNHVCWMEDLFFMEGCCLLELKDLFSPRDLFFSLYGPCRPEQVDGSDRVDSFDVDSPLDRSTPNRL